MFILNWYESISVWDGPKHNKNTDLSDIFDSENDVQFHLILANYNKISKLFSFLDFTPIIENL